MTDFDRSRGTLSGRAPGRTRIASIALTRRSLLASGAALATVPLTTSRGFGDTSAVLKVGQIQALTGPSAEHGIRAHDGAVMAADEINKAGGVRDKSGKTYRLDLSDGDMANDPRQAVTLLRGFASNPDILCVLGPTDSVGFLPMTPMAGQLGIPLIGNGSGANIKEWNRWTYRVNPTSQTATPALMRKVVAVLKLKHLAIIFDQTQEVQAGDAAICRQLKSELGYDIVADEAYGSGDQDFSAQITKVKFGKPDAIFLAASPGDGAKAAAQIRDAGLTVPLITGFGAFQDPVYWDNSGGAIAGGYTWIAQDFLHGGDVLKDWTARYNARFRFSVTTQSAFGYDSVYALAAAVQQCAKPTREALRDALAGLVATTPIGTAIEFKNPPTGDNLKPTVTILQVTARQTYVPV